MISFYPKYSIIKLLGSNEVSFLIKLAAFQSSGGTDT
jgi:hypothetical protein